MSVTASRLGSAPVTLDWSNLVSVAPGAGTSGRSFGMDQRKQALDSAWTKLKARFSGGEVGFYEAPSLNDLSQAEESIRLATEILGRGQITDCLFLGIGGSSRWAP